MKITLRKQIIVGSMLFLMMAFIGCIKEKVEPACDTIYINDVDYFTTSRTLTNHCAEGIDYIIKATALYGFYDVTAKLTIEPGVTIVFEDGSGLAITTTGSIAANGNASAPIILQGESDSDIGSWRGLIIYSDKTDNILNYVLVQGGGGNQFNSNDDRGNIVVYADAKVRITNCTILNSASYGLNSNYTDANITALTNNMFQNNHTPILIRANHAHIIDATNRFQSNTNSYIHLKVGSDISTSVTWQAQSIPYRVMAASNGLFPDQKVVSGGHWRINAGTIIEFETQTGLFVGDGAAFVAVGTANNPIKFTGVDKTAGSWGQLHFDFTRSPLNEIAFATIEYAGSDKGAVEMWADPLINIHDVTFSNIPNCAIHDAPKTAADAPNTYLTLSNNTYTNVSSNYCKGS